MHPHFLIMSNVRSELTLTSPANYVIVVSNKTNRYVMKLKKGFTLPDMLFRHRKVRSINGKGLQN